DALALLLDYYLLYVLALLLMRAWDEGDVNGNLDRITELLHALQGPGGSGRRFVDDAAGLLFVAVSHYEPDDHAYHRLLDRAGPPAALARYLDAHRRARALLLRHRDGLLADFEALRPSTDTYSPLALVFNFPHNVLIAAVVLGLQRSDLPNVSLTDLLGGPAA